MAVLFASLVFPGLLTAVGLALLLEGVERKLLARLQSRMGPSYTGLGGLLQPLWDLVKLLGKEDLFPVGGDSGVSTLSLIWGFSLSVFAVMLAPWGFGGLGGFEGDLVLVPVVLTAGLALFYAAAWSTRSIYPVLGGLRMVAMVSGLEAPLLALPVVAYMVTGSLESSVVRERLWECLASKPLFVPVWLAASILAFVGVAAEAMRDPFTVPEAEGEVAGGWLAEFSGRRLAFARLGHHVHSVAALLYYAGVCFAPWPPSGPLAPFSLLAAASLAALAVFLVEGVSARLRLVDAVKLGWGVLAPASLIVAGSAVALGLVYAA